MERDERAPRFAERAPQPRLPDVLATGSTTTPFPAVDTAASAAEDSKSGILESDEGIAVTRELVREELARDIARKLPDLSLSAQDLDRLSDAMMQVRAHRLRLQQLAHTRENAAAIQRQQELLIAELQAFRDITGMSAVDLTNALSDEGLTTEEQDDAEPVYETLPEPAR